MEEEGERRKVFNATMVLDRRAVVTATAIDEQGTRMFLGLEEGMLEEYALAVDGSVATASLTARKPIVAKVRAVLNLPPPPPPRSLSSPPLPRSFPSSPSSPPPPPIAWRSSQATAPCGSSIQTRWKAKRWRAARCWRRR